MINFHKLGYLDIRKLKAFTDTKNFWLHTYNPNWLFLWSDLYKPEIAFTNEFIFIRSRIKNEIFIIRRSIMICFGYRSG